MKKLLLWLLFLIIVVGTGIWAWHGQIWRTPGDVWLGRDSKDATEDRPANAVAESEPPLRVRRVGGLTSIQMTADEQQQTGVQLIELLAQARSLESMVSAKIIDIQPLVEAQANQHAALAEREALRGSVSAGAGNVGRLRVLHGEDATVSGRQLREAEVQLGADRGRLAAVEQRLQDLHDQIEQQWGEALAAMALADSANPLENFIAHREMLLLVTLKPGGMLSPGVSEIWVDAGGDRTHARSARLIAPATQTDGGAQGVTYFFHTASDGLRVGMRLDVWIPNDAGVRQGVEVPGAAVIWYADQLWVYKQAASDLFVRIPLPIHEETGAGWFVTEGLKAGDRIVVRGAQMLFAEEFRGRIPSEDDGRD